MRQKRMHRVAREEAQRPTGQRAAPISQRPTDQVVGQNADFGSITIRQADLVNHALSLLSAGPSYAVNLLRALDSDGLTGLTIDNQARLNLASFFAQSEIAAPGTPAANNIRVYVKDKAGISNWYFKNDAGTEIDLSAGVGSGGSITVGSYDPGTFVLATEQFILQYQHLKLASTERLTMAGTSEMYLSNFGAY